MKARRVLYLACVLSAFHLSACSDDDSSTGARPTGVGVCGDGVWNEGEGCDDGNSKNGDGCSQACTVEQGYYCHNGVKCFEVEAGPDCGNSIVDYGEKCDDGNQVSGDGCLGNCLSVEYGWKCEVPGQPCSKKSVCGNKIREDGESCDDGNTKSGDGCTNTCDIEKGYTCDETGTVCVKDTETEEGCGNGRIDSGEQCDDGNTMNGDGCSSECTIESGWNCTAKGCYEVVEQESVCGDFEITGEEECDDGNEYDGDGCSSDCKIESDYRCDTTMGITTCVKRVCGDGYVDEDLGEACDTPDTSVNYSKDAGGCTAECQFAPYCGDGHVDTYVGADGGTYSEECDDGKNNGTTVDGCSTSCLYNSYCGDGKVDHSSGEVCDEGDSNGVHCINDCKAVLNGWRCSALGSAEGGTGCKEITCGNGKQDFGEQCDEGGYANTAGCINCQMAAGYKCDGFGPNTCTTIKYGNGKIDTGYKYVAVLNDSGELEMVRQKFDYEQCDDGNLKNGDGCSSTGQIEPGYVCTGEPSVCTTVCGDGLKLGNEECDDGNKKGGDGCSNACIIETGYACSETSGKSTCMAGKCGDGKVQKGEACDDKNVKNGDGCSSSCTVEPMYECSVTGGAGSCIKRGCGNGTITPTSGYNNAELCDSVTGCGNDCRPAQGYACDATGKKCTKGSCGDGIVQTGEQCDDGNLGGGDGCSPTCTIEAYFVCDNTEPGDLSNCHALCGDGVTMWMLSGSKAEKCDDGNTIDGDGCSSSCQVEDGFNCTLYTKDPDTVSLPVTYRDFRGRDTYTTNTSPGAGYQTTAFINSMGSACKRNIQSNVTLASWLFNQSKAVANNASYFAEGVSYLKKGAGHPDFQGFSGNVCQGIARDTLDADGKPIYSGKSLDTKCIIDNNSGTKNSFDKISSTSPYRDYTIGRHILCGDSFNTWFRTSAMNKEIKGTLLLQKSSNGVYVFDSDNPPSAAKTVSNLSFIPGYFSPIDNLGFNDTRPTSKSGAISCSQSSETASTSPKTCTSRPVNANYTTEIHTYFQYKGGESLTFSGDDDVWIYINNKLFVDLGGMHARQEMTNELSNGTCSYRDNLTNTTKTQKCDKTYGLYEGGIYDIHMFQAEREYTGSNFKLTLDGFLNTGVTACSSVCGDAIVAADEECDFGAPVTGTYANFMGCVNCKKSSTTETDGTLTTCGNGKIESGEQCDTGYKCKNSTYKPYCDKLGTSYVADSECTDKCKFKDGSVCGNGKIEGREQCDDGNTNDNDGCSSTCIKEYCGDGITNGKEECDDGNTVDNDNCTSKCTLPACGDGLVSLGELCDDGPNNGKYGYCMVGCQSYAPYCGDGTVQSAEGEECDLGSANSDMAYNGCRKNCTLGAYCGDGIVQAGHEDCDPCEGMGAGCDMTKSTSCTSTCTYRSIL